MAKRSFARVGIKARPVTFFILAGLILLGLLLSITGMKLPVPGQQDLFQLNGIQEIRFGIDIRGGVEAVFAAREYEDVPSAENQDSARSVIELRMDNLQILDREITVDKNSGRILVRFPWRSDETAFNPDDALQELGEMARLTFRDPDGNIVLEGNDVARSYAAVNPDTNEPIVELELSSSGQAKFTEANVRMVGYII